MNRSFDHGIQKNRIFQHVHMEEMCKNIINGNTLRVCKRLISPKKTLRVEIKRNYKKFFRTCLDALKFVALVGRGKERGGLLLACVGGGRSSRRALGAPRYPEVSRKTCEGE
jgi:hypothetical protein